MSATVCGCSLLPKVMDFVQTSNGVVEPMMQGSPGMGMEDRPGRQIWHVHIEWSHMTQVLAMSKVDLHFCYSSHRCNGETCMATVAAARSA